MLDFSPDLSNLPPGEALRAAEKFLEESREWGSSCGLAFGTAMAEASKSPIGIMFVLVTAAVSIVLVARSVATLAEVWYGPDCESKDEAPRVGATHRRPHGTTYR